MAKYFISTELKKGEYTKWIEYTTLVIIDIAIVGIISFVIYAMLTENADNDNPYANKIEWLDLFIPMVIPSLLAVYVTIKKHNSIINIEWEIKYGFNRTEKDNPTFTKKID